MMKSIRVFISLLVISGLCISYAATTSLTGRLVVVGNVPFTQLVCKIDDHQAYVLKGELLNELTTLQGTTVKLTGDATLLPREGNLPVFTVTDYEILAVGSPNHFVNPFVGILKSQKNKIFLELSSHQQYQINGPMLAKLKKQSGAKVWLTGELKKASWFSSQMILVVDAYQIIRPVSNKKTLITPN